MSLAISIVLTSPTQVNLDPGGAAVTGFEVKWWEIGDEAAKPHPIPATFSVVSPLPTGVSASLSPTSISLGAAGGSAQVGIKFGASKNAPPTNGPVTVTIEIKSNVIAPPYTGFIPFYVTVWK
jgi:hypothetical protein